MKIAEKKLSKIINSAVDQAVDRMVTEMNKRFQGIDQRFDRISDHFEGIDQRFEIVNKHFQGIDQRFQESENKTKALIKESEEKLETYIGGIMEDWEDRFDIVMEILKDIPEMKMQSTMMFEQMGGMTEDIVINKEDIKNHEQRLHKLEAR